MNVFCKTFSRKANERFLTQVSVAFRDRDWKKYRSLLRNACDMAAKKFAQQQQQQQSLEQQQQQQQQEGADAAAAAGAEGRAGDGRSTKRRFDDQQQLQQLWDDFNRKVQAFSLQQQQIANNFMFAFVEGVVVKAVREGHWVLLDEGNLAPAETLEVPSSVVPLIPF